MKNKVWIVPEPMTIDGFLKPSTFNESITVTEIRIENEFGWFINNDLAAYSKSLEDKIVTGDLNSAFLEQLYADYFLGNNPGANEYPLLVSCLYLTQAKSAYQNKEIEFAWSSLVNCTHQLSHASQSLRDPSLQKFSPEQLKDAASKGGKARAEYNSKRVKDEAIALLNKGHQGEGWGKVNDAIDAILPALKSFVKDKKISLREDGLKVLIKRHLKNDEEFKLNFDDALSKKTI